MSASMAIERELGARCRAFPSVCAAMLWYAAQRGARTGKGISFESARACRSQAEIDEVNATYARIVACLVPWHHEVDVDEELHSHKSWPVWWQVRLSRLCTWYVSDRAQQRLADELSMSLHELSAHVLETEQILRRRMRSRGLLLGVANGA